MRQEGMVGRSRGLRTTEHLAASPSCPLGPGKSYVKMITSPGYVQFIKTISLRTPSLSSTCRYLTLCPYSGHILPGVGRVRDEHLPPGLYLLVR